MDLRTVRIGDSTYRVGVYGSFGDLSPQQRASLKEDIAKHGVTVPIVVDQAGNVLDGQHRALIAEELGLPSVPIERCSARLTDEEKTARADALNAERRHLTAKERAAWRKRCVDLVRKKVETEGVSLRMAAEEVGVSKSEAHRARPGVPGGTPGQPTPESAKRRGKDSKFYPAKRQKPASIADRRRRVAEGIAEGKTQREIADELGVAKSTIANDSKRQPEPLPPAPAPRPPAQAENGLDVCLAYRRVVAYGDHAQRLQGLWLKLEADRLPERIKALLSKAHQGAMQAFAQANQAQRELGFAVRDAGFNELAVAAQGADW